MIPFYTVLIISQYGLPYVVCKMPYDHTVVSSIFFPRKAVALLFPTISNPGQSLRRPYTKQLSLRES